MSRDGIIREMKLFRCAVVTSYYYYYCYYCYYYYYYNYYHYCYYYYYYYCYHSNYYCYCWKRTVFQSSIGWIYIHFDLDLMHALFYSSACSYRQHPRHNCIDDM